MEVINSQAEMDSRPKAPDNKDPELSSDPSQRSNRLAGKVILITGGTSGLGAESAVALARHSPARIYITGRGRPKSDDGPSGVGGEGVIQRVQKEYDEHVANSLTTGQVKGQDRKIPPKTEIIFLRMDLSSLESVSVAADAILSSPGPDDGKPRLDILLCNAGIAAVPFALTKPEPKEKEDEEGDDRQGRYEVQFATNYLGHALLIQKMLPLLRESEDGGRIVSVSSFAYQFAGMIPGFRLFELVDGFGSQSGPEQLPGTGSTTSRIRPSRSKWKACDSFGLGMATRWLRYSESKLAMVIYTRELAARYPDLTGVCVTPGFADTGMVQGMGFCDRIGTKFLAGVIWALGIQGEERGMVSPSEGAENQVWACLAWKEELKNGGLYDPVGVLCEEGRLSTPARDKELGERVWEWTERVSERWL